MTDTPQIRTAVALFGGTALEVIHDVPTEPHWACKGRRFWKSTHGLYVCATCHPPADPKYVAAEFEVPK